jgi:hypothetical protein
MKLLRLGLALTLLLVVAPGTSASTATAPERDIMALVNRARADAGLMPLRSDYRLWVLADERAAAMASSDVLSHVGALQATLDGRAIQWFGFGEVIAWTSASPASSATSLYGLWTSSAPHWELLMSRSFNYLGIGLSYSASGRTYGSIVLTESRDRTGARATITAARVSGDDVRWTWRGGDPALQTHTAGLRDYAVQMRVDNGAWRTVTSATTSTSRILANRAGGHWYSLRVRARDRAGNVGAWSPERRVWVP